MTDYLMQFGCGHTALPTNRIYDYAAIKGTSMGHKRKIRIESPGTNWTFVDGRAFLAHGSSSNQVENTNIATIIAGNPTKQQMMNWFEYDPKRFAEEWALYDSDAVLHEFENLANPVFVIVSRSNHPEDCRLEIGKLLFDPAVNADRSVCYDALLKYQNKSNGLEYLVDPVVRNEW
jgi:hypothetical protein